MDTDALECVWNGRDGWVGRPGDRGALLPSYDSQTSLGVATRSGSRDVHDHVRQPSLTRRKYDQALREAVRALRADGLILSHIAQRLEMPLGTVYHIIQEGRTGP